MTDRFDFLEITPRDFEKSLAFYRDVMGWAVSVAASSSGSNQSAVVSGGSIRILLRHAANSSPAATSAMTLYLDIHDAHHRFTKIPPGEHVIKTPRPDEFGKLHFVLRDPDGYTIVFNELRQRS